MSRADNAYDNAFMESCFNRFKAELMQGGAFTSKEDAQTEIQELYPNVLHSRKKAFQLKLYESS